MFRIRLGFIVSLCLLSSCSSASDSPTPPPPISASVSVDSPFARLQDNQITLTFDPARYDVQDASVVVVRGTFTSWKKNAWPLEAKPDGTWVLTRPASDFAVPGNSGQPEFKFVVNGNRWIGAEKETPGFQFTGNFVLLFPGDDPADIAKRDQQAQMIRNEYESDEELANFRVLEGGHLAAQRLYRSYHPFLASRPEMNAEPARLEAVQRLMEAEGVQAVINLADSAQDFDNPAAPTYYKELFTKGQVLLAATSYEDSYFNPEGSYYTATLRQVFGFMAQQEGPYLIHCRLGTDRTGVLSAVIEALMGVPWDVIQADFSKSNALGIREYRHQNLLAFSFQKMLGRHPKAQEDLSQAMEAFLLKSGVSAETLAKAKANLSR